MFRMLMLICFGCFTFTGASFTQEKKLSQDAIDQAVAADLKLLEGLWIFEKSERNGFSYWTLPEEGLYFEKNAVQHAKKDGKLVFNGSRCEIWIDPTKTPKTIDLIRKNGSPGQKIMGIYKIEGNRLIIATNTADADRERRAPGEFTSQLTAKSKRASIVQIYKMAK